MVEAGESVFVENIHTWLRLQFCAVFAQAARLHSFAVQGYYFHCTVCGDGYQIRGKDLVGGIGYLPGKYVGLEEVIGVVLCEKFYIV